MSETEHIKGTLELIRRRLNETNEELFKRALGDFGITDLGKWEDNWSDRLGNEYKDFFYNNDNDNLYRVKREEIDPCGDIMKASRIGNTGNFSFEVKYYNGGCCFTEAIETSLHILDKNGDSK